MSIFAVVLKVTLCVLASGSDEKPIGSGGPKLGAGPASVTATCQLTANLYKCLTDSK